MLRSAFSRFLAVLITGLLLASALQAPAEAAKKKASVKRTLSMSISASTALTKSSIKFSGKLSKSPKGSIVLIQRKSGAKWVSVKATRTTKAAGNYSVLVPLPANVGTYAFRAASVKKGKLKAAYSVSRGVKAVTKVTTTFAVDKTKVPGGSSVNVSGVVKPFVNNTLVSIQKLLDGKWTNMTTTPVGAGGAFATSLTVGRPATTQLRAVTPVVKFNSASVSKPVTVTTTPVIATSTLPTGIQFEKYSGKLVTHGAEAGTWGVVGGLPDGLSLAPGTGVISGTPTEETEAEVNVSFTKSGTGEKAPTKKVFIIVSAPDRPIITTNGLPAAAQVTPYSQKVTVKGNPAGKWAIDGLPSGLSVNVDTGQISGAPKVKGDFTVKLRFTRTSNNTTAVQKQFVLTVNDVGPPTITTTSPLPQAVRTFAYSTSVAATGPPNNSKAPGTWSATNLPAGLTLNADTGAITGTPTAAGDKDVKFTFVQDFTNKKAERTLRLPVRQVNTPVITASLAQGTIGDPYTSETPAVTVEGPAAGDWSASGLPGGLSVNPGTGQISGTPNASGTFPVGLSFHQDSSGIDTTKNMNLVIKPKISTGTLPDATRSISYSAPVAATGNPAGTWSASGLPSGLGINGGTGVISGKTNVAPGTFEVTLGFKQDGAGQPQVTRKVDLTVVQVSGPDVTTTSLPSGDVNQPYNSGEPTVTTPGDSNSAGTWSATGRPDGLSINASTGVISGTPTESGTFAIGLTFTQTSSGLDDTANVNLVVLPRITTGTLPDATRTLAYAGAQAQTVGNVSGTWSATGLPSGLSIDSGTGAISGTTSAAPDAYNVQLRFTQNGAGQTQVTRDVQLTVVQVTGPQITTTTVASGTVGSPYSEQMKVSTTGPSAGTWSAPGTGLPPGLSIDPSSGDISGVPSSAFDGKVTIRFVQESSGLSHEVDVNFTIVEP